MATYGYMQMICMIELESENLDLWSYYYSSKALISTMPNMYRTF